MAKVGLPKPSELSKPIADILPALLSNAINEIVGIGKTWLYHKSQTAVTWPSPQPTLAVPPPAPRIIFVGHGNKKLMKTPWASLRDGKGQSFFVQGYEVSAANTIEDLELNVATGTLYPYLEDMNKVSIEIQNPTIKDKLSISAVVMATGDPYYELQQGVRAIQFIGDQRILTLSFFLSF